MLPAPLLVTLPFLMTTPFFTPAPFLLTVPLFTPPCVFLPFAPLMTCTPVGNNVTVLVPIIARRYDIYRLSLYDWRIIRLRITGKNAKLHLS